MTDLLERDTMLRAISAGSALSRRLGGEAAGGGARAGCGDLDVLKRDGAREKNGPALAGHGAEAVRDAITRTIITLPEHVTHFEIAHGSKLITCHGKSCSTEAL